MKEALKIQEPKPFKAFRDKYLAVAIMVVALLISSVVAAQLDSSKYSPINGYGFRYKRMVFDSTLMIPRSTSPHTPWRAGGLRYNAADSTLQLWTGNQWNSIVTGIGNGVDTAYALNDSTIAIETPDEDFFVQIPGRYWDLQGILNNGSTLTENETITILDSLRFLSGLVVVETLRISSLAASTDTTTYKPLSVDASGNVRKFGSWPGSGSDSTIFSTNYRRDTAIANVRTEISAKLNISDTTNKWINDIRRVPGTDTVQKLKNGSWQFAYIDSIGGGGSQNIQQTLNIGDTTNREIIYKPATDSTDDIYTMQGVPSNFGVAYSGHGVAMGFSSGWQRFNGVNTSPRPNVVYNVFQYNTSNGGGRINTSEAAMRLGFETHFETGGADLFEIHIPQVTTYAGTIKRPLSLYINKTTGGTAYNLYALDGFNTQATNGDALFSFNGTGGYNFIGYGSNSQITLYDESLAGSRYQLQVDGSDIFHNTFGNLQRFDAELYLDDPYTNNPNLFIHDYRAANNTAGIFLDLVGTNAKFPIKVAAAVTNGIETRFDNTAGGSYLAVQGAGSAAIDIRNTDAADPAGAGYNNAYALFVAGNAAAYGITGVNYGTSAGPMVGDQFFSRTFGAFPFTWYIQTTERMRLSATGALTLNNAFTFPTADGTSGQVLQTNGSGAVTWQTPSSGITSINSQTGPAITLTGGIGTYTSAPSANTIAYNVDPTSDIFSRTIDAIMTTAGNTGTSETDLYSKTVAGGTLNADKQTLNFEADGEFNDNTATAQLKLYFGGNVTLNTGAVNISTANTAWRLRGYIIRTSSTTAHLTYELQCPGLATPLFIGYSNLTSLDFTTTNIIKITAQAGGAGGGNSDITAHSWQIIYNPQP